MLQKIEHKIENYSTTAEHYADAAMGFATEYGLKLLGAIAIFIIGRWIVKVVLKLMKGMMTRARVDETLISFAAHVAYAALILVVITMAASNIGVNTTSFVAIFASAGLAVGLALKDTLANVGAAVLIIFFRPFKVGDSIETAGVMGTVKTIDLFSTTLTTPDNRSIIIPNGSLIGGNIINNTGNSTRRIDMVFLIDYKDDLSVVRQAVITVLENNTRVLKSPAYIVAVETLGRDGVHLVVQPWVKVDDYADVKFEVTEAIKNEFDKHTIAIATSPIDLHRLA
ncbi:MAG: mechanosensitive ion channel [Sulfuricurvum sp.]|nr:mechanosensitive ion channel [Sulfuricurvum sp.]